MKKIAILTATRAEYGLLAPVIKKLDMEDLKERLKPFLTKYDLNELTDAQYTRMVEVTREPLTILSILLSSTNQPSKV